MTTLAMPNGSEARLELPEEHETNGPTTMEKFLMAVVAQNQALTRELAGLRDHHGGSHQRAGSSMAAEMLGFASKANEHDSFQDARSAGDGVRRDVRGP